MGQAMTPKGSNTPATRYGGPFAEFRGEIDRLFDNFLGGGFPRPRLLDEDTDMVMPTLDVKEDDTRILVEAELPGLDEKDVELTLRDHMLTISGEKKFEKREEKDDYHIMERRYGSFQRTLRLPETVDEEKIEAVVEKGVLKVTLPKKPDAVAQQKRIAIKAG